MEKLKVTMLLDVIDYTDYVSTDTSKQESFIHRVGTALTSTGFFALKNHPIPIPLIEAAYKQTKELFHLTTKQKRAYEIPSLKGQRGFTSFGKEHAKGSNIPDLKEFWHVGREHYDPTQEHQLQPNLWPQECPELKPIMIELFQKLDYCSVKLLEACALYLGEEKTCFSQLAKNGNSILRLIHYPPISKPTTALRAAAHEDINFMTLLIAATASGLELKDHQGQWHPIETPQHTLVVDSADMLQNMTNGLIKSTTHRVTNPCNNNTSRYSIPFFVHPRSDADISPTKKSVQKQKGQQHYPSLTAGNFLNQRLNDIGFA